MIKKILPILVLMLILSNVSVGANSINLTLDPKIIYVDDDADPEWYDDTHVKYIMDAINTSNDGDTIFVYNGTYYEKINITKSIKLIGEDKYNTIIDGTYIEPDPMCEFGASIIRIFKADEITVSGFTIQNVIKETFMVDAGLRIGNSHSNIISNNIIRDIKNTGILLDGTNHIVSENIIMNSAQGIWYNSDYDICSNSKITDNTITAIGYEGILLWCAHGNTITRNNITHSQQGMVILESRKNLIKRNNIAHNTQGVFLSLSRRNKFYENNFIDNRYAGHIEFKGYSFLNRWRRNFWDNQIIHGLPKIIFGRFGVLPIPWFKLDLCPVRNPYEI